MYVRNLNVSLKLNLGSCTRLTSYTISFRKLGSKLSRHGVDSTLCTTGPLPTKHKPLVCWQDESNFKWFPVNTDLLLYFYEFQLKFKNKRHADRMTLIFKLLINKIDTEKVWKNVIWEVLISVTIKYPMPKIQIWYDNPNVLISWWKWFFIKLHKLGIDYFINRQPYNKKKFI